MSVQGQARRNARKRKRAPLVERGGAPLRAPHLPTKAVGRRKAKLGWRKDVSE